MTGLRVKYAIRFSDGKFLRREGAYLRVNASVDEALKWNTGEQAESALAEFKKGPLAFFADAHVDWVAE